MGGKQNNKVAAPRRWATYDETKGNNIKLYALGSDDATGTSGAFADLKEAIKGANTFIWIVDWSFQPYVRLAPRAPAASLAETVGGLLIDRAAAKVQIAIHTWDHSSFVADDQNNDAEARIGEIAASLGKKVDFSQLMFRKTSRGMTSYWSNHQKFVVLDADDGGQRVIKAFFGGLDLTKGRFDWGAHPFLHNDPTAASLTPVITNGGGKRFYDDWYNAEFTTKNPKEEQPGDTTMPRQCWEDFYGHVVGPAAWDVAREFVGRWNATSGSSGHTDDAGRDAVESLFRDFFNSTSPLKKPWEDHGGPFMARVVRSMEKSGWIANHKTNTIMPNEPKPLDTTTQDGKTQREFEWHVAGDFEASIEQSYVNAISMAKDFVYIETQYFIGSGNTWTPAHGGVRNRVPQTITNRIITKMKAEEDFHAYVVIPMFPEGDPVSSAAHLQRQFEWQTMGAMANAVQTAINTEKKQKSWKDFLSFYFLMNWSPGTMLMDGSRRLRVQQNRRYMIYVHSKLLIVDDKVCILGSANLNERSLAGNRDAEICIAMRPADGKIDDCKTAIQGLRKTAWTQHFGTLPSGWETPQTGGCPTLVQQQARENWIFLQQGVKSNDSHIVALPFETDGTTFRIDHPSSGAALQQADAHIFDCEAKPAKPPGNGSIIEDKWEWNPPGWKALPDALAE
jgi:phospholipase D1/2